MKKRIIITATAAIIFAIVHFVLTYILIGIAIYAGLAAIDNRQPPSVIDLVAEPVVRILVEPGLSLWGSNTNPLLAANSLIWGVGLAVLTNILTSLKRKASDKVKSADRRGLRHRGVILLIVAVVVAILFYFRPGHWAPTEEHDFSVEVPTMKKNMTFRFDDGTKITDADMAHLKSLTSLQDLDLSDTEITDAGMAHLTRLTSLQDLNLSDTKITDAGMAHLTSLTELQCLNLSGTKITDAGLIHLKGLTKLRWLNLFDTKITDAGLAHLKGLTKLQWLSLYGTKITEVGGESLKKALPGTDISK